jgi:hypothetical protein
MVDEAQKALEEAEALKKLTVRREPPADSTKYTAVDVRITDQKLRLCDICGAFLSVYDSDRRLADHFGGKLHLGYMLVRDKLTELLDEKANIRKERSKERNSKERESSKDREKEQELVVNIEEIMIAGVEIEIGTMTVIVNKTETMIATGVTTATRSIGLAV